MTSFPKIARFVVAPLTRVFFSITVSLLVTTASAQAPDDDVELNVEGSTSSSPPGQELAPAPVAPATTEATAAPAASAAEVAQLRGDLEALKQELKTRDAAAAQAAESKAVAEAEAPTVLERVARAGVTVSGYIQAQYGQNQLSEDQLLQGGSPLNQDRFAVRRGRLRLKGRWQYVRSDFEIDGSNTRGPSFSVRRASLSGVLPAKDTAAPPWVLLTAGLTEIPLGLELQQGQDEILFMERTTGSLAMFAGPVDTGAKAEAAYGPLRLQVAVMNGVPLDDRAGGPSGIDPTRAPDYLGRVGVDVDSFEHVRVAAGTSFLSGTGFHPGQDATKSVLQWDDQNADGEFSITEVKAAGGTAATPSQTFKRWAVNADLEVDVETRLGWTKLYAEFTLANNLDRALFVADPTLTGQDARELSYYVAATQDVTQWGFVGARYDLYDPNSDAFDYRRGETVSEDASIRTISPIAGLRWPGVGRLTFQYDFVRDHLARDQRGVPADVENDQWTVRAQGEF